MTEDKQNTLVCGFLAYLWHDHKKKSNQFESGMHTLAENLEHNKRIK